MEQHKVDSDLRNQLKKTEAYARFLKSKLTNLPTGDDIGSSLPCNTHTALDNSITGASPMERIGPEHYDKDENGRIFVTHNRL